MHCSFSFKTHSSPSPHCFTHSSTHLFSCYSNHSALNSISALHHSCFFTIQNLLFTLTLFSHSLTHSSPRILHSHSPPLLFRTPSLSLFKLPLSLLLEEKLRPSSTFCPPSPPSPVVFFFSLSLVLIRFLDPLLVLHRVGSILLFTFFF